MTLVPSTAASAVYHDALSTARGWRNLCFLLLLLILLAQLGLFFAAKFGQNLVPVEGRAQSAEVPTGIEVNQTTETEQGADGSVETEQGTDLDVTMSRLDPDQVQDWLHMVLYVTLWGGLVLSILMSLTLVFTTLVMLNGRTVGVSRLASAFFWSLILLLLLIPWQTILNHPTLSNGPFHLPGVLYTWSELDQNAIDYRGSDAPEWMGWARFVFWPVVALLVLFVVQGKSRRGVKEALGEDLPDLDMHDRPVS